MTITATFEPAWTVSLLPPNRTPWEAAVEAVDADLVARDPGWLVASARSDLTCPLDYLPHLAAERSTTEFDSGWDEARQRAVVAGTFRYKKVMGTRPVLDRALAPLGYSIVVREWFESGAIGRPYTFSIRVKLGDADAWTEADRTRLIRVANRVKNAHTKLVYIGPARHIGPAPVYLGGLTRLRRTLRVRQVPRVDTLVMTPHVFIGVQPRLRRTLRVRA